MLSQIFFLVLGIHISQENPDIPNIKNIVLEIVKYINKNKNNI